MPDVPNTYPRDAQGHFEPPDADAVIGYRDGRKGWLDTATQTELTWFYAVAMGMPNG